MPKRQREEAQPTADAKRTKKSSKNDVPSIKVLTTKPNAPLPSTEIDFPRGGGSSFTPLESKAIRVEAIQELKDEQIFKDGTKSKTQKLRKQASSKALTVAKSAEADKDRLRIEHLNYKRLVVGQKLLCQIAFIHPLALIVSLPNQLLGHIPITHISLPFNTRLERLDQDADTSDKEDANSNNEAEGSTSGKDSDVPELQDLFSVGQYVTAVVVEVRAAGARGSIDFSPNRDENVKASRRVELSISPEKVNIDVQKQDLGPGFNISAVVKSIEDHGYILETGVPGTSGFLSLKEARKGPFGERSLSVGQVITTSVVKMSENGRTVTLTVDPSVIKSAMVSEVTGISSVLPGMLVQGLITSVLHWGLNVQILGFFGGTLDLFHLPPANASDLESKYKVGQKVKARILWDVSTNSPRTFALSLLPHIVQLRAPMVSKEKSVQQAWPLGTVIEAVTVTRAESEWGLVVEGPDGVQGFVHISQVSDEHVPSLSESSGLWKIGSIHRARVVGFSAIDGLLQISLKTTVIDQKYLRAADLTVGEFVKGTVKSLSDLGLFVKLSEDVDGVVWPMHYSDIKLKNPERKFKVGNTVKCRVINVDSDRNRVTLTLKKSLLDSEMPLVKAFEDAKIGLVTHGVVARILPKSIVINYFGGIMASVPLREASEDRIQTAEGIFSIGQVVRTRIVSLDESSKHITASIRQGAPNYIAPPSVKDVPLGTSVTSARVVEIQKDNIALMLIPSDVRALVSINNLANRRGLNATALRSEISIGETLDDGLIVVSHNAEKNFVIVSASLIPSTLKGSAIVKRSTSEVVGPSSVDVSALKVGDVVKAKVISHTLKQGLGCALRISSSIVGSLHPTDAVDDLGLLPDEYPPKLDSIIDTVVLGIDRERRRVVLSTRPSRLSHTGSAPISNPKVIDREIVTLEDLIVGQRVRGIVKRIADQGLFVSIGRALDGRVQIRELFDEYVKDWKPQFAVDQVVNTRVLKVDSEKQQVELTMRSPNLSKLRDDSSVTLSDLSVGDNVDGVVKKVETYGLFITVAGSRISGLCHKSELSDSKKSDVTRALRLFKESDSVRAQILSIDLEKKKINFGLKPSYFIDDPMPNIQQKGEVESDEEDETASKHTVESDSDTIDIEGEPPLGGEGAPLVDSDDDDEADPDGDTIMSSLPSQPAPATAILQLQRGFQWGSTLEALESSDVLNSDEDESDETQGPSKGRKKKKKHQIQKDLTTDMHTKAPECTADFERLLLGSPNSSFLWIQYMSFQLQLSEIDKAREIGKRAISAINFREEQEKLNIWIARLNLENTYGTDETLEACFKDAARHHDAKHMHLRMATILEETDKHEKAEEIFKKASKKFGQSSKVWSLFGEHYFRRNMVEEARRLLPRSLQSLEKRKHLKTIVKFAQAEYKIGQPERGKTIFEGVVDSHPKRLDLWSVYMDMEAGQKDIQNLRTIFERLFTQKLSSKKAKFFFKKWLTLERTLGDEESAEHVKARAVAWTQGSGPVQA